MTTPSDKSTSEEIAKQVFVSTASAVAATIILSIFFPGIGTAVGLKLGAIIGSASSR